MEPQSVVVIQDASREINPNVFHWVLRNLSLMQGDLLTLVVVLHQVITPMGYKGSVDSRSLVGANKNIIDECAARKKEEYLKNKELVEIFKLYKSKKVVFKIEVATGSSPKAVALKSAKQLKPTWMILDRKMKNDEEYFLQKLSCGIFRVRRFNRIIRLREPLNNVPKETPQCSSRDIYHADFTPFPDTSSDEPELFSIDISPFRQAKDHHHMNQEKEQTQRNLHDEAECSEPDSNQIEETNTNQISPGKNDINSDENLECEIKRNQQAETESKHLEEESEPKPNQKIEENNCYINCGGSKDETQEQKILSIEVNKKSEMCSSFGGARNYYLGGAEEFVACKQFFSLSSN